MARKAARKSSSRKTAKKRTTRKARKQKSLGHQLHILLVVGVWIAFIGFGFYAFTSPSTTGYVPAEHYVEDVDLTVKGSQEFELKHAGDSKLQLRSLRISGEVSGENQGQVDIILLGDDGSERKVYSNKQVRRGNQLTAFAKGTDQPLKRVGDAEPDSFADKIFSAFGGDTSEYIQEDAKPENQCLETCFIQPGEATYKLSLRVAEGTTFKLTQIIFSLHE